MTTSDPQTPRNSRWKGAWWTTLPLLALVLAAFTAADRQVEGTPCRAIHIEVDQLDGMYFVDAPSLRNTILEDFSLLNRPMGDLPIADLHSAILDHHGVAACTVEPTLGGALNITVRQQRPIARVWTPDSCLYLDDRGDWLPLSPRYTAPVPVVHAETRSAALTAMPLLRKMDTDPFWDGFIDQVSVDGDGHIQFRPRLGDLTVALGQGAELDERLDAQLTHLKTFYRALLDSGDLRQYSALDLRYDGQLVARK